MASVDENLGLTPESLMIFIKEKISDKLSCSGKKSLLSLIDAFNNKGITLSEFSKSVYLLFDKHRNIKQEGENPKKSGAHVSIRVKTDESPKDDGSEKNLTCKKRRILQPEPTDERTQKKPRTSRRLLERVTPSYKLIPEEQQCPVSDEPELNCLNNKYSVMQFNGASGEKKKLSKYEEAIERCEDDMFEIDMLMGSLGSAVESAEKVIKEEMRVEDLGVKFYRCIETLYRGGMCRIVREDHKKALPVVLDRLKQKLDALTVARESWKPRWKQVFEENTAKQRQATRKN